MTIRGFSFAVVLPTALIVAILAGFLALDPLKSLGPAPPPVEILTVERQHLDQDGIQLLVRAEGSQPLSIAQVQVDGAYWTFEQSPPGEIGRLEAAWIRIPYPWVLGETHHLLLVTGTGLTFEHTIEVAVPTPGAGSADMLTLVGLFVGVLPVALGMLFYPALRSGGGASFSFALALTVGLLAFLLVDTMETALHHAASAAPGLHGTVAVWMVAALTFAGLMAIGRRKGGPISALALATSIAFGIGLHNFGEGLAIGSAFATGAAALGTFLVLGFTLHNVTEGIGIVAPLVRERPSLGVFAGLALLAGLPAVAGVWLGSYAFSPHWAAAALAIGVGAILQVIVEVGLMLLRRFEADGRSAASLSALSGIAVGILVMYATALLIQV